MNKQILFIHGGDTYDSYEDYLAGLHEKQASLEKLHRRGWGQNLAEQLGEDFEVIAPVMPCKQNAKYLEWKIWFEKFIPFLRDGVILVGHSLGGLFLMKYLSENKFHVQIRSTIIVAAPFCASEEFSLADFCVSDDLSNVTSQASQIFLYHSHDDEVVPFVHAQWFLKHVPQAIFRPFDGRGHFNQETFPELEDTIRELSLDS